MRKRTDALRKPTAEERTVPMPLAPGVVRCGMCNEESKVDAVSRNAAGSIECPSCGAPLDGSYAGPEPAVLSAPTQLEKPPERRAEIAPPALRWCGQCGAEWPMVNGEMFPSCGHSGAELLDDPRKAKRMSPPAGLQGRTSHEAARLDAADRLSLSWGEGRFSIDQWNAFKTGQITLSTNLAPGENPVAAAERILPVLEQIADGLHDAQRKWYLKRLHGDG